MASMQLEKRHQEAKSIKNANAAGRKEVNKAFDKKKVVIHDKTQDARDSSKHGQLTIKHAHESVLNQHAKVGVANKKNRKEEKEKKEEKKKPAKASHKIKEEKKEKKEKQNNRHKDDSNSSEDDSDGHKNKKKLEGKKFK